MQKFYSFILWCLLGVFAFTSNATSCTRVLHVFKDGSVMTARSMDWYLRYPTTLWKFSRNVSKSGLTPHNPAKWVSKYGSIVVVQTAGEGQSASTDGMNEKGLTGSLMYLTETDYGKRDSKKVGVASSTYIQFMLDNFATVSEVVAYIKKDEMQIVPVPIPDSDHLPTMHIAISDSTGDSAVIEFIEGKVVVHHSKAYQVMTNSPTFEKQLALTSYWNEIGGDKFLPGTRSSPDRFVRASFYNSALPEPKEYREAVSSLMSVIRNASSPFGQPNPDKPNISTTLWRVVADQKNFIYYYESTISPNLLWVDLKKMDFSKGTPSMVLSIEDDSELYGEVNGFFKKEKQLEFAKVPKK